MFYLEFNVGVRNEKKKLNKILFQPFYFLFSILQRNTRLFCIGNILEIFIDKKKKKLDEVNFFAGFFLYRRKK